VWAHGAVFPASPADVVTAGADVVSHVTLLAHQASAALAPASYKHKPPIDFPAFADGTHPVLDDLFAEMRRRGTILDATASLWTWLAHRPEGDEQARDLADLAVALTRQAHQAGVEISTGSDYETAEDRPHPALIEEIEYLVRACGIPAAAAIRSATLIGARSMAAEADMGTVEAGKLANFVALEADPEADIAALRDVVCTVKRGRRHTPDGRACRSSTPSAPSTTPTPPPTRPTPRCRPAPRSPSTRGRWPTRTPQG
jgi:imidazolonepropionase-like amidohydrolase